MDNGSFQNRLKIGCVVRTDTNCGRLHHYVYGLDIWTSTVRPGRSSRPLDVQGRLSATVGEIGCRYIVSGCGNIVHVMPAETDSTLR